MFGLSIFNPSFNSATIDRPNNVFLSENVVTSPLMDAGVSGREQGTLEYVVESDRLSSATHVIFPAAPHKDTCLKLWVQGEDELYSLQNNAICTGYLLEGLAFNRQFAEGVYRGIAPVLMQEGKKILCGPVIELPEIHLLNMNIPYALVMKRLSASWRLDHQLFKLGADGGVDFLAREIAEMHAQLQPSPRAEEALNYIPEKLILNAKLFERALHVLAQEKFNIDPYKSIGDRMIQSQKKLAWLFEKRAEYGFIKRCHGDLKTANLWIQPRNSSFPKQPSQRLLALDCVDFNPKFCHIDILSDVSMLAVDLEVRLPGFLWTNVAKWYSRPRDKSFIGIYLHYLKEKNIQIQSPWFTWPLLEYYITEKAMVCAYMSVLYDKLPTLGKKYLHVALNHAKELQEWLSYPLFQMRSEQKHGTSDNLIYAR